MNLEEVGKLLTIIASFDNRKLETSTAMAWKMMLDREVPYARLVDAQEVVLEWFGTENPYFEVRHLVSGLKKMMRLNRSEIAADVRSARARGLVVKSWPENRELPVSVMAQLRRAREIEVSELRALDSGDDAIPVTENPLGLEVGRAV